MRNSKKIKSVKNVIIKQVSYESFSSISMVYDNFILELSISISISPALLLWRKRKIRTSFKTFVSDKTTIWRLKKSSSDDKHLEKIVLSSYHMEQKTFIEASCIYNIHTAEKRFCSCYFWRFVSRLDSERLSVLWSIRVFFYFYREEKTK